MKLTNSICSLLLVLTLSCQAQSPPLELSEGFAAFIIKDMETSIKWYGATFGFEIVNQTHLEERGIKMANLRLGHTRIELIESHASIDPLENKKEVVLGIFKVGYSVSDFDSWEDHLLKRNLITESDIVNDPISNQRMLIIKDPDGNRIQLLEK